MKSLDQVRDVMRRKRYSIRTEHAYLMLDEAIYPISKKMSSKRYGRKGTGLVWMTSD